MDTFDPTRGYPSEAAFRRIQAEVMLVGISSDWLFPAPRLKPWQRIWSRPAGAASTGS